MTTLASRVSFKGNGQAVRMPKEFRLAGLRLENRVG